MPFSGFLVAEGNEFLGGKFCRSFGQSGRFLLAYWIGLKGGRALIENTENMF